MKGYLRLSACLVCVTFAIGCSSSSSGSSTGLNPLAPTATATASTADSHRLVLSPIVGEGSGIVNVTVNARTGEFVTNTQDVIHVRGVAPDALLHVRVAADVGLPGGQQSDGICQRAALGQFQPLALFPNGPPATFETSPGGSGTVHVVFGITNPLLPEGGRLDLLFRVVDALPPAIPTIDLRSECFTIEIK